MISSLNIADLLFHVERLVEQTDPWNPSKCVAPITTREARKGRAAFFELRKRLAGTSKNGDRTVLADAELEAIATATDYMAATGCRNTVAQRVLGGLLGRLK